MINANNLGQVEVFVRFSWYKDDFTSDFMDVDLTLENLMWESEEWVQVDDNTWKTTDDRPDTIIRYLR